MGVAGEFRSEISLGSNGMVSTMIRVVFTISVVQSWEFFKLLN